VNLRTDRMCKILGKKVLDNIRNIWFKMVVALFVASMYKCKLISYDRTL